MIDAETRASQKYPSYKASGVPWLGEVPEHWEIRQIRTVARVINGGTPSTNVPEYWDGKIVWITPDDLGKAKDRLIRDSERRITQAGYEGCGTALAPAGSIVLSTRAPVGHIGILGLPACANQGCRLLDVKETFHSTFAFYELTAARPELESLGQGTTFTELSKGTLAAFLIALPTLDEQAAIVRYLDYVNQHIRAYVSAKERLIALLEEERQGVVHQAVTRCLDPNVRLKPSGVEWLGDVPEHWEVRRIRTLGQAIIGLTYAPHDVTDADEGKLVLRASNISGGRVVDADNVYVRCSVPDKLLVRDGDILICSRSGSRNLIGKNARIDSKSAGTTFGAFMTVLRGPNNDYLHQVFNSKLFEYQSGAFLTSTINQLTLGILNDMKIPFPPAAEQQSTLLYLKKATQDADAAIDRARRQIELMEEYRTRLIADVVTGKIDVREAKP